MITLKEFRKLFGEVVAAATTQRGDTWKQCMKEIGTHSFSAVQNPYTSVFCVEKKGHNGPHKPAKHRREPPKTNRRGLVAHSRKMS